MKQNPESDKTITDLIMKNTTAKHMARSIRINLDLLCRMGWLVLGLPKGYVLEGNAAFTGKLHRSQGNRESEEAKAYDYMFKNSKTVREVWEFFLKQNKLPDDVLVNKPGYNHEYFQELLKQEIGQKRHYFALNSEESEKEPD